MRAKPIVITVFAISSAVAAFALLNASQKGGAAIPTEHILAASGELPAGTLLRAQDITWSPVPVTDADEIKRPGVTAIETKPEIVEETAASVYGAVLRHKLVAGEPIRRGNFVKPGDRDFLQVVLSPGQRAISIPVSTGGASTGLLSPGDRVDVILTQNFKNDTNTDLKNTPLTRRSVGETIAQNLRVLAIDAVETAKPATPVNLINGGFGRTVTLEVTPEQAEVINVATELGKLSLTLRNHNTVATASQEAIKPKWAGDVSPALFAAPQEKPTAIAPKPVVVMRGDKKEFAKPEADYK
jgi:pilus assembly protein CpaB